MEIALDIAKIVALVAVACLCVYLILVLIRVKAGISAIETAVKDVATHAIPVLDNVEYITAKAGSITETVEEQMDVVKESVHTLKSMTDTIAEFERDIQSRVEGPIRETASMVRAVSKGVKTFVERIRS